MQNIITWVFGITGSLFWLVIFINSDNQIRSIFLLSYFIYVSVLLSKGENFLLNTRRALLDMKIYLSLKQDGSEILKLDGEEITQDGIEELEDHIKLLEKNHNRTHYFYVFIIIIMTLIFIVNQL